MTNLLKRLLLAAGLASAMTGTARAATISFDLSAPVVGGPFDGTPVDLVVSYDDAFLITGDERLTPAVGNVKLAAVGFPDLELLDADYPLFPRLIFSSFTPVDINFLVRADDVPLLAQFGILLVAINGELTYDAVEDVYRTETEVVLAPVPVPAGLPLLLGGLGLMGLAARRRARV